MRKKLFRYTNGVTYNKHSSESAKALGKYFENGICFGSCISFANNYLTQGQAKVNRIDAIQVQRHLLSGKKNMLELMNSNPLAYSDSSIADYTEGDLKNLLKDQIETNDSGVYLLILCESQQKSHAILFLHDQSSRIYFDPNYGAVKYSNDHSLDDMLSTIEKHVTSKETGALDTVNALCFYKLEKGIEHMLNPYDKARSASQRRATKRAEIEEFPMYEMQMKGEFIDKEGHINIEMKEL
ncbi:MAG: hypothetical protein EP298_13260 [Gammaproteobacteria bacterium]|nr:MAG: hypothetical protein EP298_13260 [Gammaproteobacteria bacterium]UTW41753.1 hypothetical protein KFE69_09575 [bacterium SCSIO 12844]